MLYPPATAMRGETGMIIPAWYGDASPEEARAMLEATLAGCERLIDPPDLLVAADGCPAARQAAADLQGCTLLDLPVNRGKGAALRAGLRRLLDTRPALRWIAVRDADGDHIIDDLPHLYRRGLDLEAAAGEGGLFCVVGARGNVAAPLGWRRAVYEDLVNEVVIDLLQQRLALQGQAWDSRFLPGRVPDLQSGYKLYSRAAAQAALAAFEAEEAAHPDLDLGRVGMELVPFVSIVLAGGLIGQVERKTWRVQPRTSFGQVDLARFFGCKTAWVVRRCAVDAAVLLPLLDGPLMRSPLLTDPAMHASAMQFRRLVWQLAAGREPGPLYGPAFV